MGKSKTLILIDGHALAFREYYALERTSMQTKDGIPTWAVYGFFKAIFDLLKNEKLKPDAIAVAFDVSHHTFRTEKFEDYKANREAMPDTMRIQMDLIYEGLAAFNIPIYTKEGVEADDVIGTISKKACDLGHKVFILTGDQDAFQLVRENGCVKVIIPYNGELIEYDWNRVYQKLKVYPDQVIDYKALRGDSSDNIPGVRGIGEKIAVQLLSEFKSVDDVYANLDKIEGKAVRTRLINGTEDAKLSKYLATILQDLDIEFDFEQTKIELPDVQTVTKFFSSMQFYSFLKNIESILKLFDNNFDLSSMSETYGNAESSTTKRLRSANGQLGLFALEDYHIEPKPEGHINLVTDIDALNRLVEKLSKSNVISVKTISEVYNAVTADVYGIAIGIGKGFTFDETLKYDESETYEAYYIPLYHKIEKLLDTNVVAQKLKPILENPNIKKLTHDVKEEDCILRGMGIQLNGVVFDTMLACYIKNSNANTAFDIQCMEQINHVLPKIITNTRRTSIADNPISVMLDYVSDLMISHFKLTAYWLKSFKAKEYTILRDMDIPLAHVLADMEIAGVSIDKDHLEKLTNILDHKMTILEQKIWKLADEGFNVNSPKQVAHVLFDKLQLKNPKRSKIRNSTSADVLAAMAEEYEIAKLILEFRKFAKLKSTYTEALPALIVPKDGRIHTTYNQTVTTTGRLSSSNPNLQNIPVRTDEGNRIRQAFVPQDRENCIIISADYSQIELRILAHVSNDQNLINAFKTETDVHTVTASRIFEIPMSEVTREMRYKAKAVNFGIIYGQTKYGLAKALAIAPKDAEVFIKKYFETYPGIKEYMHNMVKLVEEQGYVETIFGRRRYLEKEINSQNPKVREFAKRAAINQPMQGSASDLIKLAMIDFANSLKENNLKSKMIMQVHDELVIEAYKEEKDKVIELVTKAMELNHPLRVPLIVDVSKGQSWKES